MTDVQKVNPKETNPISEEEALNDILAWSLKRASWQKDALRRLITTGDSLTKEDFEDLYQICIDPESDSSPLAVEHVSPESILGQPVSLTKIENPSGINALASDQALNFTVKGLTVVYGDNGSGKSGYVRILKHACRSRDSKLKILPDINDPKDVVQSADIHFAIGSSFESMKWSPSGSSNPNLPLVSIFDSKSANTHLGSQHHVAYTPFPMMVMRELVNACDVLKSRIGDDIKNLQLQTPAAIKRPELNFDTAAGAFLGKLTSATKLSELEQLTNISEEENTRVTSLQTDLAGDPKKVIAGLTSLKSRLKTHAKYVTDLVEATSEAEFLKFDAKRKAVDEKSKLATLAAENLFEAASLPDIGGELWKKLWESARAYSDGVANKKVQFPSVTPSEDVCVLCLQPIQSEAAKRWSAFEEFVKGTTKLEEEQARSTFSDYKNNLRLKFLPVSSVRDFRKIIRDELGDEKLAKEIQRVSLIAKKRLVELLNGKSSSLSQELFPTNQLESAVKEIEVRIGDIEKSGDEVVRKALLFEIESHKDRVALQALKKDIEVEIERLAQIKRLKQAEKTTAKISITNKNKQLSDQLVTNALRARFAREISKFELLAMPVELKKQSDRNAQSYFKVVLIGKPDEPIGEILSEGEHRCVALAAFLAELVTSREYSGIVFDDPMSSLDHIYRHKVARRLVEESEHRQVIIFTHDISFLFELEREATKQSQPIAYQNIRRGAKGTGVVESDLPFKAKMAGSMESSIRSELKDLKGSFDNLPQIKREIIATGIVAKLRETWEQGIADFISPVLGRFDNNVKVNSFYKIRALEVEDVIAAQAARSRLSKDVHATAETLNPIEVKHIELVAELDILFEWLAKLRENQKQAVQPQ